jgi:septal ring factor EnvC (AmiA/AmiB activator)
MRISILLAAAALAAAAFVSACAPKTFTMQGKDADQMTKDESECRAQVRETAQRDRNIEDQRRSVFDGERERFGQQDIYTTMDNQGYQNNVARLTARCMEARGWVPKQQNGLSGVGSWWQRVSTFNTPLGK